MGYYNTYDGYGYGYGHDYGYNYGSSPDSLIEFLLAFLLVFAVVMLVLLAIAVVSYVLQSIGLMQMAKRRGIKNPWLAWIPVASGYLLGKISDDINYRNGKLTKRRILIPVFSGVCLFFYVCESALTFSLAAASARNYYSYDMNQLVFTFLIHMLLMLGAAAVAQIFTYMSLYNIFEDYYPKNKVLFTILSIFVSLAAPIIIFALRNKPPVSIVSPKGYWSNGAYINNNTFNNYNSQFFE